MYKKKWGRIVNLGSIGVKIWWWILQFSVFINETCVRIFPKITRDWGLKNNVFD